MTFASGSSRWQRAGLLGTALQGLPPRLRASVWLAAAVLPAAAACLTAAAFLAAAGQSVRGEIGAAATPTTPASNTATTTPFVEYLATWKIDRGSRAVLEEPSAWNPEKQAVALRVLTRLTRVPANLAEQWNADAVDIHAGVATARVQDLLVKVTGRATFVAAVPLPADQAEMAGRQQLELVRIVTDDGLAVDVLADHVPKAWSRAVLIDEPATVIGLPLSETSGPPLPPAADGQAIAAPALLLAAADVGWFPPTPLGMLGMDYGLFDSVRDGQKLVTGDAAAFYAMLAAVGRASDASIASAAVPPGDIVPLINPASDWFSRHRGDPFAVEGVARRATRIEVDDPLRQQQLGVDHYWELFVFVPTPLLQVHGRLQEDYPVVCCVVTLPEGMPTGPQIGERVRVSGFAFKRYGYPLPDVKISASQGDQRQTGQRQETALLIGREARWLPAPSPTREVNTLGWVFLSIAALIGAAVVVAAWSFARDSRHRDRQARKNMPERLDLP